MKKEEGLKAEYHDYKICEIVRVLNEIGIYDNKMKSKYGNKIYEIVKIKNNSIIIKDNKDDFYSIRKNEIKTAIKAGKIINLKAKSKAYIDIRQDQIFKDEEIDHINVIDRKTRGKKIHYKKIAKNSI